MSVVSVALAEDFDVITKDVPAVMVPTVGVPIPVPAGTRLLSKIKLEAVTAVDVTVTVPETKLTVPIVLAPAEVVVAAGNLIFPLKSSENLELALF